jgi:hypothetical protein
MSTGPTYLGPLDTEGIHLQSIQVPRETLVECSQGIMQFCQLRDIARQRSRFIVQLGQGRL